MIIIHRTCSCLALTDLLNRYGFYAQVLWHDGYDRNQCPFTLRTQWSQWSLMLEIQKYKLIVLIPICWCDNCQMINRYDVTHTSSTICDSFLK